MVQLLRFRAEVDSLDAFGGTPLVAAAFNGELECVQALLDARADINHATTNLNTPLIKAAAFGHVACVRFLLGSGADVTKVNNKGLTATELAKEAKDEYEKKLRDIPFAELEKLKLELAQDIDRAKAPADMSIEDRRNAETRARLQKLIADYDKVLKDLDIPADEMKEMYADLFDDASGAQ